MFSLALPLLFAQSVSAQTPSVQIKDDDPITIITNVDSATATNQITQTDTTYVDNTVILTLTTMGHTYTITTCVPNAGASNNAGKLVALGAVAGSVMLLL